MRATTAASQATDPVPAQAPPRPIRYALPILLIAFFVNTLLWSFLVVPYWGPDEASHFETIRYIAIRNALPVYGQTRYAHDPARFNVHAIHPPLYYLLGVPVFAASAALPTPWQSILMRLASTALGTLTVAIAYKVGRLLAPDRPAFALAVAAVVGFNPMFTYLSGVINNDNLINLICAALTAWLIVGLAQPLKRSWLIGLGALLGAGLLTKNSVFPYLIASGAVLCYLAWQQPFRARAALRCFAWVGGIAALISGWLFLRNWITYGNPLLVGFAHVNDWHRYADKGSLFEMILQARDVPTPYIPTMFRSFWGVFDYMEIYLSEPLYAAFAVLTAGGVIGGVLRGVRHALRRPLQKPRRCAEMGVLGLVFALTALFVVNYSYAFDYQPQGRYLFPALVPIAVVIVAGWEHLMSYVKARQVAAPALVLFMLGANTVALATALAPAEHARFLRLQTARSTASHLAGEAGSLELPFVAEQARIEALELLIDAPSPAEGSLTWQLHGPAGLLTQGTQELEPGLGLYRFLPMPAIGFQAGAIYTATFRAAGVMPDAALRVHPWPEESSALRVAYPPSLNSTTVAQLYASVRSAPGETARVLGQRALWVVAPVLLMLCALAITWSHRHLGWRLAVVLLITAFVVAALALTPGQSHLLIPVYAVR